MIYQTLFRINLNTTVEESQREAEESECKVQVITKEGYEEEIHAIKAWKEVRRMYSESISVGCVR